MFNPVSENVKLTKIADPSTAATSDVTSSSVDLAGNGGWDGVLLVTSYGTPAANNLFHVEGCDDDSTFLDVEGSEVDLEGASDEDQWIDVFRPIYRYYRVVAARGTSSTLGDVWALLYRGKTAPFTGNVLAGTIVGKAILSAAQGTK